MLRARQSFVVGRRVVRKDTIVSDDDPIVQGRETLFDDPEAPIEARKVVRPHGRQRPPDRTLGVIHAKQPAESETSTDVTDVDLESMTVPDLREHALQLGIDVGKAAKKADLVAAIAAAAADEPTDGDATEQQPTD